MKKKYKEKEKEEIKNTIKFLRNFKTLSYKQQEDIIKKFERRLKNEDIPT